MNEELIELQTRLAFHEQTLEEMNAIVTRQQNQIDALLRELRAVKEHCESLSSRMPGGSDRDERPPHY